MATDHDDLRSDFSNFGLTTVDLAGPGTDVLSCEPGGGYQLLSGTSMSTPHLAGACALLLSANPLLNVASLKQALISTVDTNLPGLCVAGGRLNLARALASVGAAWITVAPSGGTNVAPGAFVNVTVGFHAGDLAAGSYTGRLVIACNDLITPSVTIPVSMRIVADSLQVTPSSVFSSVGAEGGPFAPTAMAYTVTNTGGSSLNWAVAHTQNWVSVSANSGSLAAGASLVVTGWINSAASLLSTGIYADTLVFSNTVSGAIRPRPVALSVVTPALSIADASVLEGNSGTTSAVFTVTLIPATVRTVSVAYATANGTAQSGSDYAATNNVLTFLPGQTNATVRVIVIGDTNAEPTEIFFVNLTSPVQAVLERSQATGRILADDVGPFFDDFEPAIDLLQWAEFGGSVGSTVLATNHGGFVSGPNSLWFGATTNRYVASRSLDATLGGVVDFWLCIASGTGFPWEQADLPEEGIVLEYSINSGGSWVEFGRYDTAIYTTWTHVTAEIPGAAQTGDTQFRWRQLSHSDDCCDHWALDDVTAFVGPRPPTIIAQPASRTVTLGGTASFSVRAFGSNPLSYQWRKDGFNLMDGGRISGALSNRLTIANVLTNDAGFYSVLVTNLYGQALSPNAVLTVEIPQPPSVPFGPLPTNNATGISVHTLLSWNNAGGESLEHGATTLVELINPAATYMNGDGVGSARGLFLVSDRDLTISSVGFSVETPPGIALTANLYGTVAASTRGALLASNTSVTAGAGKIWHDVPLTYTLQAGVEYNLEFAQPSLFTSLLYLDDRDDAPFTIDGVTARDGEYLGDASNFAMGQFRLATDGGYGQAKYAVYFGTNAAALPLIATNLTQPTCNPGTLAFNTTYYWQVVASNIVGSATGAVWTFTTTLDEVRFASATNSVAENGGSVQITVVRENPAGGALSVQYATTNGTATAGIDYAAVSGTLTFAPGVLSTNFLIPILDDNLGEGNETVQLRLSLPSPNVLLSVPSNAVLIIVDNDVLTLGEALDATQLTWTTGGDASWLTQTTNTHDGLDAARSGFIDHGEESWVETTVVGPGTLSFWWKVSSESCCDPLSFFVDGVFHTSIAGESGWTQQTFPIATGTHVLRWSYSKDGSVVNGLDAGLVDQVSYVPALGVLHHFAWSPIASTQRANVPFPVMLTAQDGQGNTVSNFTGPVALSGLVRSGVATNTILGPLIHSDLFPGTFTIGYILTPNADLVVTHLRHYWGSKVSIWNDAGTLLRTQNIVSTPGAWVETPLSTPVTLLAGNRYRVGAYSSGSNYYWLTNGPTNFASGTIDLGCYSNGDAFPTTTFSTDFNYLVDLRYTVAAYTNIPITPASASNFVAGLWTGMVTVPSVATNATLLADDGSGHFGVSNPFNVLPDTRPVLLIVRGPGGMVDLSFASLSGVNYVLEYKNSLSDVVWIPLQAFVGDGTIKTRTDTPGPAVPQRFYRLRLP